MKYLILWLVATVGYFTGAILYAYLTGNFEYIFTVTGGMSLAHAACLYLTWSEESPQ